MTADEYIRQVEFALRDLPWGQRCDLVADLRRHLAELPADSDLGSRLGTPEQYASDLRAAEGLERRHGPRAFLRARRPRNVILVTLVVVVLSLAIGTAIGTLVWIDSYQPLRYGDGSQLPLDSRPTPGESGVTVTFRKGRPFLYGITISNVGHHTVRILGVPTYELANLFKARLLMSDGNPRHDETGLRPFRPFELKPDGERWLVWKGVYECAPGSYLPKRIDENVFTETVIPVRYSFLWRTATAEIPLEYPLAVRFKGCLP